MEGLTPKPGQWIARPKKPRWVVPAVALIVFSTQIPNWINLLTNSGSHPTVGRLIAFGFIVVMVLIVALTILINSRIASRLRPKDQALADGAFGDQYLVEVTIGSGKTRFGTDRGVLWFSDDLMGFSGDATSFVLSADDISIAAVGQKRDNTIPMHAVTLKNAPRPGYFVIHPLNKEANEYRKRLQQFASVRPGTYAERIWPPLEPYEEKPALDAANRSGLGR